MKIIVSNLNIIISIILVSLLSCTGNVKRYNLPYDLPNEVGMWVSVSDTTYESSYYLIRDSIYACEISFADGCSYDYSTFVPPLPDVDVASFEVNINEDKSPYARDKNNVYFTANNNYDSSEEFFEAEDCGGVVFSGDLSIKGADPQTFQYIGNDYAFDKTNIYYEGRVVKQADLQTFKVLGYGYAIDKENMYHQGFKIKWNDHVLSALQHGEYPDYLPRDYGMTEDEL